jgi:CheY-like chemotaxis protein
LVNLLNNAAKYTPAGGHVSIVATRSTTAPETAEVHVTDDGAGIPKDLLESVFELFVQSRRTLDRAAGGLGVGLSLARSLVEMHGGGISARSDGEGKGSEFIVWLPLTSATPAIGSDACHDRDRTCAVPPGGTVLVVEDSADSRETLCELLRLSGFTCAAAENGAAALALLEELRPIVAIIDLGLPEMDGFELARRIRSLPAHADACLIALSGYGQPSDLAAGREAGFDTHLIKPVRIEQLLAVIEGARSPAISSV